MKPGMTNKRPRSLSDDEDRPARPEVDEGERRSVTEEEVEEFYSILRRMREVRNGNRGVGGRRRGGGAAAWVPAFKLEDFEEGGAVRVNGTETPTSVAGDSGGETRGRMEVAEDDWSSGCLNLNAKPDPAAPAGLAEPESIGDSTAPRPSSRP